MRRFMRVHGTPHLRVSARSAAMPGLCFLLLALGASGCSGPTEVCLLRGCEGGLSIELVGDVPEEFTVTAEVLGGGGLPFTVECSPGLCEGGQVFLVDFTPDKVRITVEAAGTTTSELFEPSYEVHRPNGAACPPECLRGVVVMQLPEDSS